MVALNQVRAELATLKQRQPGLVAVFVGGTSGIGEATARAFVQNAVKPHVYLVGRSKTQADAITAGLKSDNADAQVRFIQSDVSLLRNVDQVCDEIKRTEDRVNLLFLSAGMLTMAGRNETQEGLDTKLSLHCYSRLRMIDNLLPLLRRAAQGNTDGETTFKPLARVISVLGGGLEARLNTSDLSLKHNFSLSNCANHGITMTSLSFARLAASNPGIAFIHTEPGGVRTNIARNFNPILGLGLKAFTALPLPFMMNADESGVRHAYAAMTDRFDSGGLRLLGRKGVESAEPKDFAAMKTDGTMQLVSDHMSKVFADICDSDAGRYEAD